MIIESLLNLFASALKLIFGWINLPDLPGEVETIVLFLFDAMESGIGLLFMIVDMDFARIMLPLLVIVINFDKVYKLGMFVLRKIPFLGID